MSSAYTWSEGGTEVTRRKNSVTPLGWEIKKRLAEKRMTQREFCQKYGIPESRMTNIITGTRKAMKYRRKIKNILGIGFDDLPEFNE